MNNLYIVILAYNYQNYIKECIDSVLMQSYNNYKVVIIDDASTDNTNKIIKKNINNKFRLLTNKSNKGTLYNHIQALANNEIRDNDIVIHIDGDDKLIDKNTFSIINKAYTDNPDHLVSYGNYITASNNPSICKPWDKNITVSNYIAPIGWIFSHLRTFKYKLWKHINKNSFYDKNGEIFSSAGDVAIMKPVLELAGRKRTMYISRPLYYYRDNIPTNDHNKNLKDQVRCALEIRNIKPLKCII